MNISLQEIVFLYRRSLYHCLFHFSCHYRKNPACRYLSAVRSFRYGSHLRNPGYTFLSAVQLMVYAGGIVVLYVFSILLTQSDKNMKYKINRAKLISVLLTIVIGAALVLFLVMTNGFALNLIPQGIELPVENIGHALIGTGKYQFVLPFEVVSVLLLACMIGAILIARKQK
mgnify:CR=1 FL=1